jgi:hypothetical protein
MKALRISDDRRRIVTEDGGHFYFLGDTAWELFHALSMEEAELYLTTRAKQGFNFIQAVVLAELNGLEKPNFYGRRPLKRNENGNYDPSLPDTDGEYSYFDHLEAIVTRAEKLGLYMGILPTWGDKWNKIWGQGPEIFTPENAFPYGKWLAEHLVHHDNIVWILGGDRPLENEEHYAIIDAMADGIRAGDGGKFLITLHPCGARSSSEFVHERDWLDFNMLQSGHGRPTPPGYEMLARDFAKTPVKPTMDGEQVYEDHPINFNAANGYYDAADVRVTMWRNLLSGSCGNTYGHHSIWCMNREPGTYFTMYWKDALHRPAAEQMRVFRDFIEAHDLTSFVPAENLVKDNAHDANYVAAMVSEDERAAVLAAPNGCPIGLDRAAFPFEADFTKMCITALEPSDGRYTEAAVLSENGRITFKNRAAGRGEDIILLLKQK